MWYNSTFLINWINHSNSFRIPKNSTQKFFLLRRTLYNYPKLTCLHVFYSGEHFTTLRNWHVYMCSTQENTLQLPNICKSVCVLTQENTLQLSNICESTSVLLLIFCFSVGEAGEVVQGVMLLRSKLFFVSGSPSNIMLGDQNTMLGI